VSGSEARAYRWGVAATGGIARDFVKDLTLVDRAHALAVGFRTVERAEAFATPKNSASRHPSFAARALHFSARTPVG
jgi:hypothetical protein